MSVVAKFFIRSATESPGGSITYDCGAVCRGEENKHWAAATPSGVLKMVGDERLANLWNHSKNGGPSPETEVVIAPADDGDWQMDLCAFSYGGCSVKFRQPGGPWGVLEMTINATAATKVMREAFAQSLLDGNPAKFTVTVRGY